MAGRPRFPQRADLVAGAVVAIILVPQAMAYAELAGVPAIRGLLPAAVAAVVGAAAGSSPHLQTGPTATASLLTVGVLAAYAEPRSTTFVMLAAMFAVLVGAVRIALGLFRAGQVSFLLSQPVIEGLANGAGIVIVASQVPTLLGSPSVGGNPLVGAGSAILSSTNDWNWTAAAGGAVALVAMLSMRRCLPRWPAALFALALGWVIVVVGRHLVPGPPAPVVDAAATIASVLPSWPRALDANIFTTLMALIPSAAVVAVVGFCESAAIARRYAAADRTPWDPSRELLGQGAACVAAGVVGGFPTSGSFSRSALSRMAGATSRWSAIVAGLVVVAAIPLLPYLALMPRAVLAAVVIAGGADMVDLRPLRRLWRHTRLQFVVAAGTLAATLLLAPRVDVAVLAGVVLAAAAHLLREQRVHIRATVVDEDGDKILRVDLYGVLFYLSAPRVSEELTNLLAAHREAERVALNVAGLGRVDVSGALALEDIIADLHHAAIQVSLVGVPPQSQKVLHRLLDEHTDMRTVPPTVTLTHGAGH